jgi:hypothetical protein
MPDSSGRLTQADNEKIQQWWTRHWKSPVICPVCKTSDRSLADHVVNIQRHALDSSVPNAITYPHIIVGCKTCAHAMFFNAVSIGVATAWEPPKQVALTALGTGIAGGSSTLAALSPSNSASALTTGPLGLPSLLGKKDKG